MKGHLKLLLFVFLFFGIFSIVNIPYISPKSSDEEEINENSSLINETLTFMNNSNLTMELNDSELNLSVPNETLSNGILNETNFSENTNEAIHNESVLNETTFNETSYKVFEDSSVETKSSRVVLGKPVRWVKFVNKTNEDSLFLEIPKEAENITLKTGDKARNSFEEVDKYISERENEGISLGITGFVVSGDSINFFFDWFLSFFENFLISGRVIDGVEINEVVSEFDDKKVVEIEEGIVEEVSIEYFTPGPEAYEELTVGGKKITIYGPDELNYEDILAYTFLGEETETGRIQFYHIVDGLKIETVFEGFDENNNGLVDYIEWNVPHLSNQTYEIIIEITNAEHLDSNRVFIEDVFQYVGFKDENFKQIPNGNFLRVVFESNLTSSRDITIYARGNNSKIEVYKKNSETKIAEFEEINSYKKYRIILSSLEGEEDTFDLKSIGDVEYDYVIDPILNWPMFRNNLERTGYQDETISMNNFSLLWEYSTSGIVASSPAVSGGVVYVGSDDSRVYALNASTGSYIWDYRANGAIASSPAVYEGSVYFGSDDGSVYSILVSNGHYVWDYRTGAEVKSSPAVDRGVVYVGSNDGYLYALDYSDGSFMWGYSAKEVVQSSPALGSGLSFGVNSGMVYGVDASGNYVWEYQTGSAVISSPAVSNGVVYVGSMDGTVYALGESDGSYVWSYGTSASVSSSPAVYDGVVYIGSDDGNLYAIDASDGSYVWSYGTSGGVTSSPAVSNGVVYFGSLDGNFYALNASNGNYIWNYTTGGYIRSSPAISEGVVYVGSDDGKVYAFYDAPDTTPPAFTNISNITSSFGEGLSYDINATDNVAIDVFWINDTTNFAINSGTGVLTNATSLSVGIYYLNVSVNDTSGNTASEKIWVLVNPRSFSISKIYPSESDVNVTQNEFFKIDLNVSCLSGTCGSINVSLDPFSGGDGTPGNPYQISNCTELQDMKDNLTASYIIVEDIDCSDTINWEGGAGFFPIGNSTSHFTGTFDGGNHTINNLFINRPINYVGFFGVLGSGGIINNVGFVDVNVTSVGMTGVVAGSLNGGSILNSYSAGVVLSQGYAGGIVGYMVGGLVNNSYSTANVSVGAGYVVGGLGGFIGGGTVSNSYSTGKITGSSWTGGLTGYGAATNSFWDTNTSTQTISGGGVGKNTTQMKNISTFLSAGWDIVISENYNGETWYIDNGNDYPKLGGEFSSPLKSGLIPVGSGNPFYTNASSNPLTTSSLNQGQYEIISFWVNATGEPGITHEFFAFANLTSNLSISNETAHWNVTISPPGEEIIPPTYSNIGHNLTYAGQSTKFSILWDDETALNPNGQYIFSTNNSGIWVNDSAVNFTITPSWANVTKVLNSTVGVNVGYRWYATDNAQNMNFTNVYSLLTTISCGSSLSENTVYTLTENLSSSGTCFNITSENVTLNCNGFSLNGNNSLNSYGVYSNKFNTTIKNCYVQNFSTQIALESSLNSTISNVSTNFGDGIRMIFSEGSVLENSRINATGRGVLIEGNQHLFTNSNVTSYLETGVHVQGERNNLTRLNVSSNSSNALSFEGGSSNNVSESIFYSQNNSALYIHETTLNRIYKNSFSGRSYGLSGVVILTGSANDNFIFDNSINAFGTLMGLSMGGETNTGNLIRNNTFLNSTTHVNFTDKFSSGNTFCLNNFTNASQYVYDLSPSIGGGGYNFYNCTYDSKNQGNIWDEVISGLVEVYGLNSSSISGLYLGEDGSGFPFSYSASLKFYCPFADCVDYVPLTPFLLDVVLPEFSNLEDQTLYEYESLNYDIDATDNIAIDIFWINDTTDFVINSGTGVLTNVTALSSGVYTLNVSVNDTSGNIASGILKINVIGLGILSVELISPTGTGNQPQTQIFTLRANVSCSGNSGETCGVVSGYARYNGSSANPDTNIQGSGSYSTPFYSIEGNPQNCEVMNVGSSECQLIWQVNATGTIGNIYSLDVLFSSNESITSNNTQDFSIKIISPILSLVLSEEFFNVGFGNSLLPGTENNPALNNSESAYNVTCFHTGANCNVTINANDLYSGLNIVGVGNVSWGKVNNPLSKNPLSQLYQIINSTLPDSETQPVYFWMDVPQGLIAGDYKGNFTVFGSSN